MLKRKKTTNQQKGFSIIELVITMTLVGIASGIFFLAFNNNLRQYLGLQRDASAFTELTQQSQRITNVLRGSTDIIEAEEESITVYAYFFPNNEYVSLIKYYLNNEKDTLFADVTPMTSNPPIGTPITSDKKTYTVIPIYSQSPNVNLFDYIDSGGNEITHPITDLLTIKAIRINLVTPSDGRQEDNSQSISTEVSLRNRKTNL